MQLKKAFPCTACPEYFTSDFEDDDTDPENPHNVKLTFHMHGGKVERHIVCFYKKSFFISNFQ